MALIIFGPNNTSIVTISEARSIIISTASPPTKKCITHTSYNTQAKKNEKHE